MAATPAPVAHDVEAAVSGDRAALERVLTALAPQIWAIARRIMGNDADAADASQEALIAIARGIGRFDGRSALTTWAHRVSTNACLDELRRRNRRAEPLEDPDQHLATSAEHESIEHRLDLDRAMAELSSEHRAVVVLRDVVGHDYETIATILDIPIGTVRSRLARARTQLVERLRGDSPELLAHPPRRTEDRPPTRRPPGTTP